MTRDELLALLTVERYAPRPQAEPTPRADDSEVTTARRRRELGAALAGWDVPREGPVFDARRTG